jgi:hypothetical protein
VPYGFWTCGYGGWWRAFGFGKPGLLWQLPLCLGVLDCGCRMVMGFGLWAWGIEG